MANPLNKNERQTAGPAMFLAATPVSTKMPAPIVEPMPMLCAVC